MEVKEARENLSDRFKKHEIIGKRVFPTLI